MRHESREQNPTLQASWSVEWYSIHETRPRLKVLNTLLGFLEANKVVCLAFVCISQSSCNQCFTQKSFGCCFGRVRLIHVPYVHHVHHRAQAKAMNFHIFQRTPATDLLRPISCAYEFGVPQASGQFHQGDGPYKGGVWDAESNLVYINLAVNWMVLLSTPSGASHMDISGYTLGYNLQPFLLWRCSCHCMDFSILLMEFPSTKTWLWTGEEILSDHVGCVNKARDTAWRRERVMLTTWIERLPLRYRSKKLSEAFPTHFRTCRLADII